MEGKEGGEGRRACPWEKVQKSQKAFLMSPLSHSGSDCSLTRHIGSFFQAHHPCEWVSGNPLSALLNFSIASDVSVKLQRLQRPENFTGL